MTWALEYVGIGGRSEPASLLHNPACQSHVGYNTRYLYFLATCIGTALEISDRHVLPAIGQRQGKHDLQLRP